MRSPIDLLSMGIAVIPCFPRSKVPTIRWQRYQTELPAANLAAMWFRSGSPYNAAAVCGWNGLTVFDFDTSAAYEAWCAERPPSGANLSVETYLTGGNLSVSGAATTLDLTQTYSVRTARGVHVYLYVRDTPLTVKMGRGLDRRTGVYAEPWGDIKGRGSLVLIPPSIHPSGARYEAINPDAPILSVESVADVLPEPPAEALPPPSTVFSAAWLATGAGQGALAAEGAGDVMGDDTNDLLVFAMCDPRQRQEGVVDRIKRDVPILSLFPDARPSGRNRWYVAHCPWHDDRNESLWIDTERGLCGCYAGCLAPAKAVDVIGTYARLKGVSRRLAVRELATMLGVMT